MKKTIHPSILFLIMLAALFSGCNPKQLSRSQAQSLIEANSDFKRPYALVLTQGQPSVAGQGSLPVLEGKTETPAEAETRRVNVYFEMYPQVAVAHHLGLVEPQIKSKDAAQPQSAYWADSPAWWFDEKYVTTAKAKQLWADLNLPLSKGSVPLAKKEFIEVTGITKQGEDAAQAQFTWQYTPNETAKYFDSSTSEFQSLPADLQQKLLGKQPATVYNNSPEDKTIKFATTARQGQARFRRYDDGWRLEAVLFQ